MLAHYLNDEGYTNEILNGDIHTTNQNLAGLQSTRSGKEHLSMHSSTEQEMLNLEQWLEEAEKLAKDLDNLSLIISHHLKLLQEVYKEKQKDGFM